MGSKAHKPTHVKLAREFVTGHEHDFGPKGLGPGVRAGARSYFLEAREHIRRRGVREERVHLAANATRRASYARGAPARKKAAKAAAAKGAKHSGRRVAKPKRRAAAGTGTKRARR
ncbi:MAG: hypothetical protein ACYDCK_11860 [Thermoplasmatota archaeon]